MTKKLFLLRGLIRESRHWGDVPNALQKVLPNIDIITPNIPGAGPYHQSISPNNFDEMINFMRNQYSKELTSGSHALLAMSMGGMIAKRWTELYPQDFSKLILVNTSFKGINPVYKRLQPGGMLEFLKIFLTLNIKEREKKIINLVSNAKHRHDDVHKLWAEIQQSAPVSRKSFFNQITAALTYHPSLEKPVPSVYILAGEKDRICSVECSKKLHELWGGEISIHPNAGHDLPIDAPEWFMEKVQNILAN
jgi:pimeloyl-ACP methyl ester carboxylesterase